MNELLVGVLCAALCQDLGNTKFPVREKATHQLESMGETAVPYLKVAAKSPDPEIRSRANRLLDHHFSVFPSKGRRIPSLTILCWRQKESTDDNNAGWNYCENETVTEYIKKADGDQQHATSLYMQDLLRQGVPKIYVQSLLDDLAKRYKQWTHYNYGNGDDGDDG